ncbi:MAG: hypothetical protein FJ263_10870 [Planctomycetes bacterium]|nr:hypothetical protein [Planctomycetota bacterium]
MISRWILGTIGLCLAATVVADTIILPEGFVLNGTEGVAQKNDAGAWSFVANNDLIYMNTTLPAKSPLPILSSGGLEQIRAFAKEQTWTPVKIWGILTLYKKQNFLFPIQVLALSQTTGKPAQIVSPKSAKPAEPNATKPESSEVIPPEIMKILRSQSKIDLGKLAETADVASSDFSLIGKTGYVELGADKRFMPDGFGRKIDKNRFSLLPCLTLEDTEENLAESLGRQRYNISGIVTVCDGKKYLLLYRAVRTYSNSNFTP